MNDDNVETTKKDQLLNAVRAVADSLIRIESEQEHIKDVCKKIKKMYDIKPSVIRKAAKAYIDGRDALYNQENEISTALELVEQVLKLKD